MSSLSSRQVLAVAGCLLGTGIAPTLPLLAIAPIAWWNDDLAELSDDVSLEECLRQASVAGFTGMETGRRFPMDMAELGPILQRFGISVCGGWFSGLLLDGDIEVEKDRIAQQMAKTGLKDAVI